MRVLQQMLSQGQEVLCVSRMNGRARAKAYAFLVKRDGEYCKKCGISGKKRQLVIDHKDNDNSNNQSENWQLLCRTCNYRKNPRPVDNCVCENENATNVTELQVSRTKEPMFKRFSNHLINEYGSYPENDLINSGAEHVGISPVTAKRYLNKMCSLEGIYQRKQVGRTTTIQYKDELPLT